MRRWNGKRSGSWNVTQKLGKLGFFNCVNPCLRDSKSKTNKLLSTQKQNVIWTSFQMRWNIRTEFFYESNDDWRGQSLSANHQSSFKQVKVRSPSSHILLHRRSFQENTISRSLASSHGPYKLYMHRFFNSTEPGYFSHSMSLLCATSQLL